MFKVKNALHQSLENRRKRVLKFKIINKYIILTIRKL